MRQSGTTRTARGDQPSDPFRCLLYRLLFALAAAYNLAFGAWAILRPYDFFDLLGMGRPIYPAVWQCLGMVVGVYGLGYAYAARRLDRARPFITIGLLGKVLGPIGWIATVRAGEWPLRTFTLILFNDIVWWLPFGLFLLEETRAGARLRAAAPWACSTLNFLAVAAMALLLRPGTEVVDEPAARLAYIARHPVAWRAGWGIWIAAALSLLAFYAWWGARIARRRLAVAAFGLALAGLGGDLLAESLYIGWLPDQHQAIAPVARLLTGAFGNGLYTAAGILLTLGTGWLRGVPRLCAWIMWAAGGSLTFFSVAGSAAGMAVSTAVLFLLFCPWVAWLGWRMRAVDAGQGPDGR